MKEEAISPNAVRVKKQQEEQDVGGFERKKSCIGEKTRSCAEKPEMVQYKRAVRLEFIGYFYFYLSLFYFDCICFIGSETKRHKYRRQAEILKSRLAMVTKKMK